MATDTHIGFSNIKLFKLDCPSTFPKQFLQKFYLVRIRLVYEPYNRRSYRLNDLILIRGKKVCGICAFKELFAQRNAWLNAQQKFARTRRLFAEPSDTLVGLLSNLTSFANGFTTPDFMCDNTCSHKSFSTGLTGKHQKPR